MISENEMLFSKQTRIHYAACSFPYATHSRSIAIYSQIFKKYSIQLHYSSILFW